MNLTTRATLTLLADMRVEDAPRLEDQAQCVASRFREQFGHEPAWLVAVP